MCSAHAKLQLLLHTHHAEEQSSLFASLHSSNTPRPHTAHDVRPRPPAPRKALES